LEQLVSSSLRFLSLAAVAALLAGCGPSKQKVELESNIKAITVAYGRYFQSNRGQPPASEAELKAFVEKMPPEQLGVKDPAGMWVSTRDKQPYVVVYGQNPNPPGPSGPVVVYESKGVNGRRYVGTSLGNTEEVTEERFRQLVPSASAAP
jgi:hypothetical protein